MAVALRLIAALALTGSFMGGSVTGAFVPAQAAQDNAAQDHPPSATDNSTDQDEEVPTPAPLVVGAMAIASDAALAVERMAVDVTVDHVRYTYGLRNRGQAMLSLAASIAMPELEVNTEGTTIYNLPTKSAENPVGLQVSANGAPVPTVASTQALALGIDRLAELKAASIPLVPFDADTEKAIAAASPETSKKLVSLGLVTPRDPAEPDTPALADWTLHTMHSWMQALPANATTEVKVDFAPVKAVYGVLANGLPGFDALKDQACLTPKILAAAKALLKTKDAMLDVYDITLANEGPARWLDNPPGTVTVTKPKPDAVVAFCGMTAATAADPVVKGKLPGSADSPGLRVLIFVRR